MAFEDNSFKTKESLEKFKKYVIRYYVIFFIIVLVNTFLPSRNTAIMMFSAGPIINTAKDIKDSNRTKSIVNILDNSIKYLEKKSKDLSSN